MTEPPPNPPRRLDLLPIAVLLAIAALLLALWLLFPMLQNYVFWQDCTASGRTNC